MLDLGIIRRTARSSRFCSNRHSLAIPRDDHVLKAHLNALLSTLSYGNCQETPVTCKLGWRLLILGDQGCSSGGSGGVASLNLLKTLWELSPLFNVKLLKILKHSHCNITLQPGINSVFSGISKNELELFCTILTVRSLQNSVLSPLLKNLGLHP